VKPVGVPGGFWVVVVPARVVEPVDGGAEVTAAGARLAEVDVGALPPGFEAVVVGVLDDAAALLPVTPALRGDDEL